MTTTYIVRLTASDSDVLSDLRSLAASIERGDLEAPLPDRTPLVRALAYVEESTGWEAWTTSYLYDDGNTWAWTSDPEEAAHFATAEEAFEMGDDMREFGESVHAIPVES